MRAPSTFDHAAVIGIAKGESMSPMRELRRNRYAQQRAVRVVIPIGTTNRDRAGPRVSAAVTGQPAY
jgi:hypothetical protein